MRPFLPFLFLLLAACERPGPSVVTRGVYHWSNSDFLREAEQQFVDTHAIELLYWKALDIDWNEANQAHPVSIVRSPFEKNEWGYGGDRGPWADGVELVPVVFITNRTMLNCDSTQLRVLADKLQRKLTQLCGSEWKELQLDCDWSPRSKDTYFSLVRMMRERVHRRLSVTVRLHQYKDPKGTGVPPADRGMLMLYNVEDVKRHGPQNSIFNTAAAKPYFSGVGRYPLPLDVALPAYSWLVHYRQGRFVRIENSDLVDAVDTVDLFQRGPDGLFHVVKETERWWGESLHIGDELKLERMDSTAIQQAVDLARTAVNSDTVRVVFFDLPTGPRKGITHSTYEHAWEAFR